jgi:hypothetical protein
MIGKRLKSEIDQRTLSDLGRGACLHANHASRKSTVGCVPHHQAIEVI